MAVRRSAFAVFVASLSALFVAFRRLLVGFAVLPWRREGSMIAATFAAGVLFGAFLI
jgi:hypothetical protein